MENNGNKCKKCGGEGKPSTAFRNEHYIRKSYLRGETEFEVKLIKCIKCQECGHSWIPERGITITQKVSLRQLALKWWNNLLTKQQDRFWFNYVNNYFSPAQYASQLTSREIEIIWKSEINKQNEFKVGDIVECIKDISFYDTIGNQNKITQDNFLFFLENKNHYMLVKSPKKFEKDLFSAYIDKFSEEDRVQAFEILYNKCKKWDGINNAAPFYMDICRAFNSGKKERIMQTHGEPFKSSHEYFIDEFGFKK